MVFQVAEMVQLLQSRGNGYVWGWRCSEGDKKGMSFSKGIELLSCSSSQSMGTGKPRSEPFWLVSLPNGEQLVWGGVLMGNGAQPGLMGAGVGLDQRNQRGSRRATTVVLFALVGNHSCSALAELQEPDF